MCTTKNALFLFILCIWQRILVAQNYYSISVEVQTGKVFAHNSSVENVASSRPLSVQLRYAQTLRDSAFTSLYHCGVQRGFVLNMTNFRMPILGQMYAMAYYLQPTLNLGNRIRLGFTPTAGVAYCTSPYNKYTNPENYNYSTNINLYVSAGAFVKIKLRDNLQLNYAIQFNHVSNGSIDKPNSGINWYLQGLGLEYKLNRKKKPYWLPSNYNPKGSFYADIAAFYTKVKRDTVTARYFEITGLSAQVSRRWMLNGLTVGFEIANDQLYQAEAKRIGNAIVSPWLPSVFMGHEFLFGRFIFNQQLGIYTQNIHNAYTADWYHRWGFLFYPIRHLGLGINFKVHGFTANLVDARVVYQIK